MARFELPLLPFTCAANSIEQEGAYSEKTQTHTHTPIQIEGRKCSVEMLQKSKNMCNFKTEVKFKSFVNISKQCQQFFGSFWLER